MGPFGSSGFKTGARQTPQSDFKIALFAQFGFWEKLKSEKVFGSDPILLSHFFLLPCIASRPLIYDFYCIFLKMSYNTASLKVKIPAKQPKPTTVKQPKPKSPKQTKWSAANSAELIRVLTEQQATGNQSDNSWKSCVWTAAEFALRDSEPYAV